MRDKVIFSSSFGAGRAARPHALHAAAFRTNIAGTRGSFRVHRRHPVCSLAKSAYMSIKGKAPMNILDKNFNASEAVIRYLDADYVIVRPGNFVRCAVTGKPIPLDELS
jgi:hypothetical protein